MQAVSPDRIQQTSLDGRNVFAFTVNPGDIVPFDRQNRNVGPGGALNQRAEFAYGSERVTAESGRRVYTMGLNFGQGFPMDQRWAMVLQFHGKDTNPKPGFTGVSVHGSNLDVLAPFSAGQPFASIPIQPGQWYDLKLDVNWSAGNDGYVKVYNGDQLVGQYNGPTASSGTFYYLKQGYYRDGATQTLGTLYETPISISGGTSSGGGSSGQLNTPPPSSGGFQMAPAYFPSPPP